MSIEDLDTTMTERDWRKRIVQVAGDHGDLFEPIDRMISIFGPILFVELYMQTVYISALLVAVHRV